MSFLSEYPPLLNDGPADALIYAYARDEEGLTAKECSELDFDSEQCTALLSALDFRSTYADVYTGEITFAERGSLRSAGIPDGVISAIAGEDGRRALNERMNWLSYHAPLKWYRSDYPAKIRENLVWQVGTVMMYVDFPMPQEVISNLIDVLNDTSDSEDVRVAAVQALGRINGEAPDVELALCKATRDQSPKVRMWAIDMLSMFESVGKAGVAALVDALKNDSDPDLQERASSSLSHIGKPAIEALTKILSGQDKIAIVLAADAFDSMETDPENMSVAVPFLRKNASDPDYDVRESAIAALGAMGPYAKSALKEIVNATSDVSSDMRAAAFSSLASIEAEDSITLPLYIAGLSDPSPEVRAEAASACGNLGRAAARQATGPLIAALDDKECSVREQAAISLGYFRRIAKKAIPALTKLATEKCQDNCCEDAARGAAFALVSIGYRGPEPVDRLIAVVNDPKYKNVVPDEDTPEAAYYLGRLGPFAGKSVKDLGRLLTTAEDPWARQEAAIALPRIGPEAEAAAPELVKAMDDDDFYVQMLAEEALRVICPEMRFEETGLDPHDPENAAYRLRLEGQKRLSPQPGTGQVMQDTGCHDPHQPDCAER